MAKNKTNIRGHAFAKRPIGDWYSINTNHQIILKAQKIHKHFEQIWLKRIKYLINSSKILYLAETICYSTQFTTVTIQV